MAPSLSQLFDKQFAALHAGRQPFRWQRRLFDRFFSNDIPATCSLPTGLGKTAVIPIWLIALSAQSPRPTLPRRLVYIVNRRTVVDQATDDAKRFLQALQAPAIAGNGEGMVCRLRDSLAAIACDPSTVLPLAVSTLRGEFADNGEWKTNPARPAIIIGTIDMIGSKLLFSGYGDGRYGRAHHAGLIGQDTLIVHDEAHLSPAFSALLRSVETEQKACQESRPIRLMELSATTRGESRASGGNGQAFGFEKEDREDPIVQDRLNAVKNLTIETAEKGKLVETIVAKATLIGQKPRRVLIYVRSPKTAGEVAGAIKKKLGADADDRIGLLTGTIRGFERDELARSPLFMKFHSNPTRTPLSHAMYLVSTSAGEVGADLDADDLVCDQTTLDSLAQRFGRVNRLGGNGRAAEIMVVREKTAETNKKKDGKEKKASELDAAVAATGAELDKIVKRGGDVSPAAISEVLESEEARAAFSPVPTILPATDILYDAWSLTSIQPEKGKDGKWRDMPGRPQVEPYLHGVADWEPPETQVAWRAEIRELADAEVSDDDLEEILKAFPIRAAEQLKDTTSHVIEQLVGIVKRHRDAQAILIKNGEPRWIGVSELAPLDNDKASLNEARRLLSFATILLPCELGGLKDGMLNGECEKPVPDVAEVKIDGQRDRQRVWVRDDQSPACVLSGEPLSLPARHKQPLGLRDPDDEDSGPSVTFEYRVAKAESGEPGCRIELTPHNDGVANEARRIGTAIGLHSELCAALSLAGRLHDSGKDCGVWQRYAKNYGYNTEQNPAAALAKAASYQHWKVLNGYRHEFGSLMNAAAREEVKSHPERELILHLIASHHGWARPHFKHDGGPGGSSAYDPAEHIPKCQSAAADALRRYAALQRRFGRWGLAWLESLVRAADAAVSDGGGA